MATRKTTGRRPSAAATAPADFATREARALAILCDKHQIAGTLMRHREWRNLFIRGASPEDAAEHVQRLHHNSSRHFERIKRR
jgi:hypothetical protein